MSARETSVWSLAEPIAAELGLEILDVELRGDGAKHVLRIFLDGPSGVTLADCEAVSRRMGDVLDANDAVPGRYMLEVSSPGLNRPLRKPDHFKRAVGERIRLKLATPVDGSRNLVGRLQGFENGVMTIADVSDVAHDIDFEVVEKANVEYEFPEKGRPSKKRRG